jgi:hypothetical protein
MLREPSLRQPTSTSMPVPECWRHTPTLRLPKARSTACAATVACPTKGRLLARVEEAQANIVVGTGRREHERHLCMRELASHGEQSGVALTIGVEHDGRRIAGEACGGKCVYLEYAQESLRG